MTQRPRDPSAPPQPDTLERVQRAVDDVLDESDGMVPDERVAHIQGAVDEVLDGADGAGPAPLVRVPQGPVDPWAEKLVRVLDDGVRVPGTNIGFGLDAIIGFLLPGAGDMLTGLGSLSLLVLAIKRRVPTVAIGRMVVNIGIDTLLGSIPVVGDVFDLFWRSNRKNLEIIEKYQDDPGARPSSADYALVAVGVLLVLLSIAMPLLIAVIIGGGLAALLSALFSG